MSKKCHLKHKSISLLVLGKLKENVLQLAESPSLRAFPIGVKQMVVLHANKTSCKYRVRITIGKAKAVGFSDIKQSKKR